MSEVKSNLSSRLLAAFLSVMMVFSMIPFTAFTAFAATTEHPDAVTITVSDEEGAAIEGAEVQFVIDSIANGDEYITDTLTTDEYGCVEIMASSDFVADDLTVSATVSKTDYTEGIISNESITSGNQDFAVKLTSTVIKGVTITANSGLVYDGKSQSLVTITGTQPDDTITYKVDGVTAENTEKTDAGTYKVEVTVARDGYTNLEKTFEAITIAKADIKDIDIAAVTVPYSEAGAQNIVTLTGSFKEDDVVEWSVNDENTGSRDIPQELAIGNYSVKLTVKRGNNYNDFVKTVNSAIQLANIELGSLSITANELTYNGEDQKALTVKDQGDYDLQYSWNGTSGWTVFTDAENYPTVKDHKDEGYTIYVKATKANHNDKEYPTYPISVNVAKAPQELTFTESNPNTVTINSDPAKNIYDFSADGENLSGNAITYSLIDATDAGLAEINSSTGELTILKPGIVTVYALREGNNNYLDAEAKETIVIKIPTGGLVEFGTASKNYVLDEAKIASEEIATKKNEDDNGKLSYSIDKTNIGLSVDASSGKITVSKLSDLNKALRNTGSVSVTVKVDKAAGTKTTDKWTSPFTRKGITEEVYPKDSATYILTISRESAPSIDIDWTVSDPASTGWYNEKNPAVISVVDSAKYSVAIDEPDNFESSKTITKQGENTFELYFYNKETKKYTAPASISLKIDTVKPTKLNIQFHNTKEENFIQKVGELLGFYNPSVTITFSAEDATSGLDHFEWIYTPEGGTPRDPEPLAVKSDGTADLTLPADQAEQLHGKISFTATDKAGNEIGKTDSNYVFIVDTIAPELSVKYQGKAPYEAQVDTYNNAHFFNSDVEVELTVTETNFYKDDVVVKVSKNGGVASAVTPSWTDKVGKFTLTGDGDYIVYVTYSDKSHNEAKYTSEVITVDKTKPVVKIDYVHEGDNQKTVFTVTEHNFRASDVTITGTMKDIKDVDVAFTAARLTEILRAATWTQNGDTYTTEYDAYVTGIYNLNMDYKDIAGWDAEQSTKGFTIDHDAPTDIKIEYAKSPMDDFLEVITLGFYNPSVTVRFTAYDTSSGVKTFTWGYTKQTGASTIKHPENLPDKTIDAVQDQDDKSKFTAEITLTADEAAQYRGYISALATDDFGNKSDKKTDDGNIIVVDTIAPEITVEYTASDRVINSNEYFYNNAVDVKFTVTEANFYAEDVNVTVTKNGKAFDFGTVNWGSRNAEDKTIGTFTLPAPADHSGDGHYVIAVEYKDRSNNEMAKYVSGTHTIDTTAPVINVKYDDDKVAVANELTDRDGNTRKYYADTKTATVTITEHNFIADEVDFTIIAKDVTGAELDATKLNSKTNWSVDSTGDVHTITITYPGDANYSFDVAYTDKATNAAEDYKTDYFTVDKTDPTNLTVSYSTSVLDTVLESVTFGFYNAKMTVTLTAEDPTSEVHSFLYSYLNASGVSGVNAQLINEAIQAADIKYSEDRKTATVTFEIPKMVLGNDNQFNGTVEFTATDRAGNETDSHKETKRIVVDNIAPTAQVSYNEATNVVGDISYYNGNITATVTINEANFYANDVKVMVSKDGGAATAVTPSWRDNSVDVHVGTFTLSEDGDYIVTINYTDKSSNKMATYTSKQMTVDTKIEAPTYTINGVAKTEIGGAYKGEATIGFNFADQNFDNKTIKLTRTRFDKVEDVTDAFVKVSDNDKGGSGTFSIPTEVGNDGIYVLNIGMTDKAKHTTESEIKFTINRYGSVYEYSDELIELIKDGGQYVTSVEKDLVITEYNADRINEGSLKILITHDGKNVDVDFTSNPENINSQVAIGESGWYQYVYTIKASNFKEDGVYKISLTSAYDADDVKGNESTSVPENSITKTGENVLDTMAFTVDSVAPEIRNIVNLDKAIADVDKIIDGKLNVKYTIVDVGGLKKIEIIVNGKTIQTLDEDDIAENAYNFTGNFDLEEQDGTTAHKVQIKVTDRAGNMTDTNSPDFLKAHSKDNENSTFVFFNEVTVSRNFFVRWYANTGLFWGSIAGVVVLAGGIWFLIAAKRKKKES